VTIAKRWNYGGSYRKIRNNLEVFRFFVEHWVIFSAAAVTHERTPNEGVRQCTAAATQKKRASACSPLQSFALGTIEASNNRPLG
jgi:hypothetical protein